MPLPIPDPQPRYVCRYVTTPHEQSIFDQIDQEDADADRDNLALDCYGTKRAGNINWRGTKEHWLIQLDYISKNPQYGDREFSIPNASIGDPTQRGYADIVNLQSGAIFEIKPNNEPGLMAGRTEVNYYVNKANQNCTNTLPSRTAWNAGTGYSPVLIPMGSYGKYLEAAPAPNDPGVILYRYLSLTPPPVPNPSPIALQPSMIDKFKELIRRLKNNLPDADRIIAEFCTYNPDLENYIKTAAVGAGVVLFVGTLVEDLVTGGVGAADDPLCFALAWRIIRFAVAR